MKYVVACETRFELIAHEDLEHLSDESFMSALREGELSEYLVLVQCHHSIDDRHCFFLLLFVDIVKGFFFS